MTRGTLFATFPASNGRKNGGRTTGLRHLVSQLLRRVTALEGRQEHPIEVEDNSDDEAEESSEDEALGPVPAPGMVYQFVPIADLEEEAEESSADEAPVPVPVPGMVYQLVPIEDLEEEEEVEDSEVEDSEVEEGLAIEIAALDPAPPYIQ